MSKATATLPEPAPVVCPRHGIVHDRPWTLEELKAALAASAKADAGLGR